jgi:hypothetical protein
VKDQPDAFSLPRFAVVEDWSFDAQTLRAGRIREI